MKPLSPRFFLRLVLFCAILCTLPTVATGFFGYHRAADMVQTNANEANSLRLLRIETSVEQLLRTVDHSLTYFSSSSLVQNSLYEPLTVDQFQLYNQMKKDMNQLQTFDTGLQNVVLLSTLNNWYFDNTGLYRLQQVKNIDEVLTPFSSAKRSGWMLQEPFASPLDGTRGDKAACPYNISLFQKLPLNAEVFTGVVTATLPACFLDDLITYDANKESVMILDGDARVVVSHDPAKIGTSVSGDLFYGKIKSSASQNGQFEMDIDDIPYTVAFRESAYNGWTYVSMLDSAALTHQSRDIGWFTLSVCASVLLLGLFVSWAGTRRLYSPIQQHFRDALSTNTELERKLTGQIGQLRQLFAYQLIQGGVSPDEIGKKLATYGYANSWQQMAVLTLQIDTLEGTSYRKNELDLLLFAINNMVEDLVAEDSRLTPIIFGSSQVTIIRCRGEANADFNVELDAIATQIQVQVRQYLKLSVSVGVSLPYTRLTETPNAYREGVEALKYRIRLGQQAIIFFNNVRQGQTLQTNFPKMTVNELLDAVQLADLSKVEALLGRLFQELHAMQLTLSEYQIAMVRLLLELLQLTKTLGLESIGSTADHPPLFDQLFEKRTAYEYETWFRDTVIHPILTSVEERMNQQYHSISEAMIHQVQTGFDTDLTLESIAAGMHYNAKYLSSVFRKETNRSFSEYLASYRHEIAKKWLVEGDMSIREISGRLQYNNPQNFIRSFRKAEGMTPGQYREGNGRGNYA